VPWDAAWRITHLFSGNVRFVRASSGHIAGIMNPPGGKGTYWTRETSEAAEGSPEEWLQHASRRELVAGLDGMAFCRPGPKERTTHGQREVPTPAGCARHLCDGKVEWLRPIRGHIAQRSPVWLTSVAIYATTVRQPIC
jgi:hypothetical protein